MTRHLQVPIWMEWSTIQTQSSARILGPTKAASPMRSNQSRPVNQAGEFSSGLVGGRNRSNAPAAQRNDAPLSITIDTNRCTTPSGYC